MGIPKLQTKEKPHAIFIPFPLQGHLTPLVKLSQLLHHRGFHITFIVTEFMEKRLVKCATDLTSLSNFDFESFPDGLPPSATTALAQDMFSVCDSSRKNFFVAIRDVVLRVREKKDVPVVTCVVAEIMMPFTISIAKELGVPCMLFWTASACSYMVYKSHRVLREEGIIPIKDKESDIMIDCIPGMKNIRIKDLPFLHDDKFEFPSRELEQSCEASGIILNTFDSLEHDVLQAISSIHSNVYTIGPLQKLLEETSTIRSNLFEEEPKCLKWLDTNEPNSVIYISFGSLLIMTMEELIEFAWGIINSGRPFVWVIRRNLVNNEPTELPCDLLSKVMERGIIVSWCPQEQVLNHPSIGGFITHSGWNSTLDSMCAGVPIISWPWIGDQPINCRYSCTEWGVGMEIDQVVRREQVEKLVRELMDGDYGKELKKNAMKWKKLAKEATSEGGSTCINFERLVKDASHCCSESKSSRHSTPHSSCHQLHSLVEIEKQLQGTCLSGLM